ncbi:putative DNA polymerase kappa, putative,DNA polymerase IV [Trypanosoma grayi]|uniref:putative DNA polymerase kappa, putative,DNA polymerase IV n=1 Tax=Trypanosoma grayi TaxID=71804 RepID=UPI0004F435A7|nr:putative DNA polymerase kappa, putative,DNA polymerase IV [Trypanosoma grayi]KEG05863.1 putative DNA polymerase kappa, putative,DNA polymerase IV [Trypanosoma grayi]
MSNLEAAQSGLLEEGMVCRQVVLKIKRTSFQVQQFTKNLPQYTDDFGVLRRAVEELLLPIVDQYALLRLLGVRLTGIIMKEEYTNREKQHRSGMQRSLSQYCSDDVSGPQATTCGVKREREEDGMRASSGIEVVVVSQEKDDEGDNDSDDDDVVVCLTPPKTVRQSEKDDEGDNDSDDDDVVVCLTPPKTVRQSSKDNSGKNGVDVIIID